MGIMIICFIFFGSFTLVHTIFLLFQIKFFFIFSLFNFTLRIFIVFSCLVNLIMRKLLSLVRFFSFFSGNLFIRQHTKLWNLFIAARIYVRNHVRIVQNWFDGLFDDLLKYFVSNFDDSPDKNGTFLRKLFLMSSGISSLEIIYRMTIQCSENDIIYKKSRFLLNTASDLKDF